MQYMANSKQGAKKRRKILDADKENAVSVLYLNDIYDSYRHLYHRMYRSKRMIMIMKEVISVQWKARRWAFKFRVSADWVTGWLRQVNVTIANKKRKSRTTGADDVKVRCIKTSFNNISIILSAHRQSQRRHIRLCPLSAFHQLQRTNPTLSSSLTSPTSRRSQKTGARLQKTRSDFIGLSLTSHLSVPHLIALMPFHQICLHPSTTYFASGRRLATTSAMMLWRFWV